MNRRALLGLLAAGAASTLLTVEASASDEWCIGDPIVRVGGRLYAVKVGVPRSYRKAVDTAYLSIKAAAEIEVLAIPQTFFPVKVNTYSGAGITMLVSSALSFPVMLEVVPLGSPGAASAVIGRSNSVVALDIEL